MRLESKELGKQFREFEDVPSLHQVFLEHYKKKILEENSRKIKNL